MKLPSSLHLIFLVVAQSSTTTNAFQSFLKSLPSFPKVENGLLKGGSAIPQPSPFEDELIDVLSTDPSDTTTINSLIQSLEESAATTSIPEPAISNEVLGKWRLLYTTNENTASPIQRKALDATKYNIYQDIILRDVDDDDGNDEEQDQQKQQLIVSQVINLGTDGKFTLDALAFTSKYPLPSSSRQEVDAAERERDGTILGVNVIGVSKIGDEASEDPTRPNSRINFLFDEGKFTFFNDGKLSFLPEIPYPVPFRSKLFEDARKGWLDITYLSKKLRITKGNKGTTFILVKENDNEED